jgi:hypothetical protein
MDDDTHVSTPAPYEGLAVRSNDIFPLVCPRCQRRFTQIHDFISRTTPIFQSSGLLEREDPETGTFVLLLRNCLCGTSLALRCHDRRNRTERGKLRRDRFGTLVNLLVEVGVEAERAQLEVRRLLHSAKI